MALPVCLEALTAVGAAEPVGGPSSLLSVAHQIVVVRVVASLLADSGGESHVVASRAARELLASFLILLPQDVLEVGAGARLDGRAAVGVLEGGARADVVAFEAPERSRDVCAKCQLSHSLSIVAQPTSMHLLISYGFLPEPGTSIFAPGAMSWRGLMPLMTAVSGSIFVRSRACEATKALVVMVVEGKQARRRSYVIGCGGGEKAKCSPSKSPASTPTL